MSKVNFFSLKASEKFGEVFFVDTERLIGQEHIAPGWYFWDIDDEPFGPFLDEKQTVVAVRLYTDKLLKGDIKPKPRLLLKPPEQGSWS